MRFSSLLTPASLIVVAFSIYSLSESLERWKDPRSVSDTLASDVFFYGIEGLLDSGMLYPSSDLDDPLLKYRKIMIGQGLNQSTSKDVVRKLLYLDSVDSSKPIDLYVSTAGGWYDSAFTIIDTINSLKSTVNTLCIGGCYSAGLLVMASGTGERVAYENAYFSAHVDGGGVTDDRPYGSTPDPDRVNRYVRENLQLPEEWLPLGDDIYYHFSAAEAVEFGVIDKVVDPIEVSE